MLAAFIGAMGKIGSITVSSDWGTTNGAGSTITSPSRTMTVPGGNPGNVTLTKSADSAATEQYQIDAGSFTSFSTGAVVAITNGQTLTFRMTGTAVTNLSTITVTDSTTGAAIGSWTGEDIS